MVFNILDSVHEGGLTLIDFTYPSLSAVIVIRSYNTNQSSEVTYKSQSNIITVCDRVSKFWGEGGFYYEIPLLPPPREFDFGRWYGKSVLHNLARDVDEIRCNLYYHYQWRRCGCGSTERNGIRHMTRTVYTYILTHQTAKNGRE